MRRGGRNHAEEDHAAAGGRPKDHRPRLAGATWSPTARNSINDRKLISEMLKAGDGNHRLKLRRNLFAKRRVRAHHQSRRVAGPLFYGLHAYGGSYYGVFRAYRLSGRSNATSTCRHLRRRELFLVDLLCVLQRVAQPTMKFAQTWNSWVEHGTQFVLPLNNARALRYFTAI